MEQYFTKQQDDDILEWLMRVQQDPRWWEFSPQQQLHIINQARLERAVPDWMMELRYRQPIIFTSSAPDVPATTRSYYSSEFEQFQPSQRYYLSESSEPFKPSLPYDPDPSEPFQPSFEYYSYLEPTQPEIYEAVEGLESLSYRPSRPTDQPSSSKTELCPYCHLFYKKNNYILHTEREENYIKSGLLTIQGGKWWCNRCENRSFDTFSGYTKHNCVDNVFHSVKKRFT
jgi:hypothetical protein